MHADGEGDSQTPIQQNQPSPIFALRFDYRPEGKTTRLRKSKLFSGNMPFATGMCFDADKLLPRRFIHKLDTNNGSTDPIPDSAG
jgi:hypothetical protein